MTNEQTVPGHWSPPRAVRERGIALQGTIPHAFGSIVRPGEAGQLAIKPGTAELKRLLRSHFPGAFTSIGDARPRDRWPREGQRRDLHAEGRALDLMSRDQAVLERFANAFVWHAEAIGVQYVLTLRLEWSASRISTAWEVYGPQHPSPHTDHVHLELSAAAAADAPRVRRAFDAAVAAGWDPL